MTRVDFLRRRSVFELLLAVALVATGYYLVGYVPRHAKAGEPVLALTSYFLTFAPIQSVSERAYVLPDTLQVWDTPAAIRDEVGTLRSGDQVRISGRYRGWYKIHAIDGPVGWVSEDDLTSAETHDAEQRLLKALAGLPVQATGQPGDLANVHIEPSRTAALVAQVSPGQTLEIFSRKLVTSALTVNPDILSVTARRAVVWYLIRTGPHAGWIIGDRVQLTVPKAISSYAQDANLVAWLPLNTVDDNGHRVPQWVIAERSGTDLCDFTKVEVLTWWKRKETYAVAYRVSDLRGYFPITVTHEDSIPHFRLQLMDDNDQKYQDVYALYETITRRVGTAYTWDSDAEMEPPASHTAKRNRQHPLASALRSSVPTGSVRPASF